ncbi:ribonucleoside-diphosphate reductase subunit alpha [Anaerobacillus alkalidiazotrophicus]|uniref:Ribonucleoside-diphosphate reductase n=1 Tax=Anaerobacillus alkalidiazotrophicus TaxID=472963 RepID=A0A1S2MCE2_9BACI|nr:ribonucleoside-diphosphate reductase subunit alpha [Anaerobacillus alkalidiazotrophicus]OIJ22452.1 ribonucleoside-diphosphate reductase subunit alpha [Anaerobacillus alkalidiazotrophicus]
MDYKQKWEEEITNIINKFPNLNRISFEEKSLRILEKLDDQNEDKIINTLILETLDQVSSEEPDWTYIAAQLYLKLLYKQVERNRGGRIYQSFNHLIESLYEKGIYSKELKNSYDPMEINELERYLTPKNDQLFTYIGLKTLADRYLAKTHEGLIYELPQERFLIIAMTLMSKEPKQKRLEFVKEAYWALSNLYMTVATPTLANAGKSYGQLSSCFIDTVDDSLRGIFDSNTDAATVSKNGGGLGLYLGKIRAKGSSIKGFKGNSSGVLPWMKQLNNTAVSVDQLGQRQGAIAVYLDVWHKDIFSYLDAKLNNGDERLRTHDLFTGVCIPDCFMEMVEQREEWYLFDPHEVRQVMGFSLEDYYDEEQGKGSFREKYQQCIANKALSREVVSAIEIFKRIMISQLETGTPYMFYRDTVNRLNPNKHAGMIYGSNLCTEIMQNMSATTVKEEATKDGKIIVTKQPGDYVVCNLSSISLARAVLDDVLERLIPIQIRMLDNVIDLNRINVLQAEITNQKYRAVGLGTFGWHHLLALKQIKWESNEAVEYSDHLYEKINYLSIKASLELAKEKGAYPMFKGSEWESGKYFDDREYHSQKWKQLKFEVMNNGIRNGYLLAVAPNSSTSIIAGSTASIDPIFKKEYSEEKKNYKIPVTAPDLSATTTWYYKPAHMIDQHWSVKQNGARQKHIDQAISFNIYVKNTIRAKELLELHIAAWKAGLKTTYYVRSTSSEIEECESCSS